MYIYIYTYTIIAVSLHWEMNNHWENQQKLSDRAALRSSRFAFAVALAPDMSFHMAI